MMIMSACVCSPVRVSDCVRKHISRTTRPIFTSFAHVTYNRDSVLLWQRCETLCTSISSFMDDVMFEYIGQ